MSVGERSPQPIKNPRRFGPTGAAVQETLLAHGIRGVFFKNKHAHVEFSVNGWDLKFHFACTPSSADWDAKKARRDLTILIARAQMIPPGPGVVRPDAMRPRG